MSKHIITVIFALVPMTSKAGNFWKKNQLDSPEKLNIMKTLSFNTFLCSRPCLPSEILSIKAVLVACFYVFPNSEAVPLYEKREQATKTTDTEYFTLNPGQYPKISFPVTL